MNAWLSEALASRLAFAGGFLAGGVVSFQAPDLVLSMVYAASGAVVSFIATVFCKACYHAVRERFFKRK